MTQKRNIWTVDPYVYKASSDGLRVYALGSTAIVNFISVLGGINSVWADDQTVYMATTTSGIYSCSTSGVATTTHPNFFRFESGGYTSNSDFDFNTVYANLSDYVVTFKKYPDITADEVLYLHGNGDYLCATTVSGVDRYKFSTASREYIIDNDAAKCFQAANGDHYYVVNEFYDIIGLDDNVFNWQYGKIITLSGTIPSDGYKYYFEIPLTQPDEIYIYAGADGKDLRIIDDAGHCVTHYIESWDRVTSPKIWVILSAGTEKLYMLYGNQAVNTLSDISAFGTYNPSQPSYTFSEERSSTNLFGVTELHAVYDSGGGHTYGAAQANSIKLPHINDLFVTEDTSIYTGGNVIFLATSWGAVVIEEKRGDESNCRKKVYLLSS